MGGGGAAVLTSSQKEVSGSILVFNNCVSCGLEGGEVMKGEATAVEGEVTAVEGVVTAVEGVVTAVEGVVTAVEGVVTEMRDRFQISLLQIISQCNI